MALVLKNPWQLLEYELYWQTQNEAKFGAHVTFTGTVRSPNLNKTVTKLVYEAHEHLAQQLFLTIEQEAMLCFGPISVTAIHAVGEVGPGNPAVILTVSAPHRKEAFLAAQFIMDELKKRLPIWKCEYYSDGSKSWDHGICSCK